MDTITHSFDNKEFNKLEISMSYEKSARCKKSEHDWLAATSKN